MSVDHQLVPLEMKNHKVPMAPPHLFVLVAASLLSSSTIVSAFKYSEALEKTLLFFEAQRSGKLPNNNSRIPWRKDSGLKDGKEQGVDLVGGYYDGGGHVKYGFPMAFTVTLLSWSVVEYHKELLAVGQLDYTLGAIRWGTDYFIKAHAKPQVLWAQVGDGDSDNKCWQRAEEMTTPRTAYMLNTSFPGSDLAGETAAALAAASLAFKPYDSQYSNLLLVHAKQLFTFADRFRGRYDKVVTIATQYYPSYGYMDELLWASTWLYKATDQDDIYLKYAVDNAVAFGGTTYGVTQFNWENKFAGVQILLSKVLFDGLGSAYNNTLKEYNAKAEYFLCSNLGKNGGYDVDVTPGGLLYWQQTDNLQFVSSSAFLLSVYSGYMQASNSVLNCTVGSLQYFDVLKFAQTQADYILGKNPRSLSYLVGFGRSYPTHLHHSGASIKSIVDMPEPVSCVEGFEKWFKNTANDPNVLFGAVVGGPDKNDSYIDQRWNPDATEPNIYSTAPLVGLFAKLNGALSCQGTDARKTTTTNNGGGDYAVPRATNSSMTPLEFVHVITTSWAVNGSSIDHHQVNATNISNRTITNVTLRMEGLRGELWGLNRTNLTDLWIPSWTTILAPNNTFTFVYNQGGPQANVTLASFS